jgi:tight adherence protein B
VDRTSVSLLVFAAFTAIALAFLLAGLALFRRLFGRRLARRVPPPPLILRRPDTGQPLTSLDAEPRDFDAEFARLVSDSDLPLGAVELVLAVLACALLAGGVAWIWNDEPLVGIAGALTVILLFPPVLLARRARRRLTLREQLPMMLDLIARAVRAGQSLDQAFALIGAQSPPPWGPQFRVAARQLESGLSVQAAVAALWRRTRVTEVQELLTVLTVHRQTGGNLSDMLERLAANARDRLDFHRQFRSATAGARYATVLMLVAFVAVFGFFFVNDSEYSQAFLRKPEGLTAVGLAVGLMALGIWWIQRVLRVDY